MNIKTTLSYFLVLFFNLLIAAVSFAVTDQLPQTGQTRCYDVAGADIQCAGTGQDGELRSGVAWPVPRFQITHCDAGSVCANQSSDCDSSALTDIVTDSLTGLMWPKSGNLAGGMNWNDAVDFAASLNLCGYSDWNLPNINELDSLVNADVPNTAVWLNGQGLTDVQSFYYWSSTTAAFYSDYAWIVNMWYGGVVFNGKNRPNYVLPVRTGQIGLISVPETGQRTIYRTGDDGDLRRGMSLWPEPRFSDNENGAVTDNLTGLMWLKDANCIKSRYPEFDGDIYWGAAGDGAVTWQHALDFVKNVNNMTYPQCGAGYNDWRLPDTREIRSLIDHSNFNPVLPAGHFFTNVQSYFYWTSTTSAYLSSNSWTSGLWDGGLYNHNKDDASYVWPVRSITITDSDHDGYASDTDCNDNNADIHPGAAEICDGLDNDCDTLNDDNDPDVTEQGTWYPDNDGDGFGNPSISLQQCVQPDNYVTDNTDYNDNDPNIYPGSPPVRTIGTIITYHATLQAAYDTAETGDIIQSQSINSTESLNIDSSKSVSLLGGYDHGFTAITGETTLNGQLTISNGKIIIENLIVQ